MNSLKSVAYAIRMVFMKLKIKLMKKFILFTALAVVALYATSCNVTRTITTKSEYWQKADTSVIIQTKTIETYDASKKGL